MTESLRHVLGALYAQNLRAFVRVAFEHTQSADRLRETQAMRLLCETLHEVAEGKIRRQIINMPPRTLKSFITSICFPAWLLGRDPRLKIALLCRDERLATELADPCREIMRSEWYRQAFPNTSLRPDASEKMLFKTTAGGQLFAASIHSGLTGQGFDLIIVDDPLDAGHVSSNAQRETVNNLFDNKISSRLNNLAEGKILIVMQRLHPNDLCGHVERPHNFSRLAIPLIADEAEVHRARDFEWQRPAGDIIDPVPYTQDAIDKLRQSSTASHFSAQYQQSPLKLEGGLVKAEYFNLYGSVPPIADNLVFSCDFGQSLSSTSSYSAVLVFRGDGTNHYLIDATRRRLGFIDLRDDLLRLWQRYLPQTILIENTALGVSLIEALRESGCPVSPVQAPRKSKVDRLQAVLHVLSAGKVLLPKEPASWLSDFLSEICAFPGGGHDDQVDALSQYLEWAKDRDHPPMYLAGSGSSSVGVAFPRKRLQTPHPMRDPKALGRRPGWPSSRRR